MQKSCAHIHRHAHSLICQFNNYFFLANLC